MGPIKYLVNLVSKFISSEPAEAALRAPMEVIGSKRYRPVGQCIYCGATQTALAPLTDEHVIPYALNGNWVLPRASCRKCAVITGAVEHEVLRGELWHLRAALNFQTRRPAERPATVQLRADDRDVEVPISDCPIAMPFIRFPTAGLLDNRPSKKGIDAIGQVLISWGSDPGQFARQRGFHELSFQKTLSPASFARMIGKIGYAHFVARFGLDALQDELVTDVILGRSQYIGDVVGCTQSKFPTPKNPIDHILQPVIYKGGLSGNDRLVAIRVKLFAGSPTPVYEVIIGKPADHVEELSSNYYSDSTHQTS
jgi:hypothetical protein